MIHEELLESNLGLDADGKHEGYELDVGQGAGSEGGEFNQHGIEQAVDGKDASGRNGSPDLFPAELDTRAEKGAGLEGEGEQSEAHECSNMLIDCPPSEGDASVLGPNFGEENSVMDTAELCYDAVVLPTLPADGSHEAQGAPVDYAETHMSSPGERGVLISTVPPLPPTFFQTTHMDVTGSASWEELHSTHAESGYGRGPSSAEGASPGSGNSTERAFVDSVCEEPLNAGGLEIGKEQTLSSGPSLQDMGTTNAGNPLLSSGISDAKNEDSSSPTREDGSPGGGGMLLSGPRDGKEKGHLGELSLRRVLSDFVTGMFMDDAMVAMCGHLFGSGGLQRVLETHSCLSCGASVPLKTLVPNVALRAAVLAYKHEDHVWQQSSVKGTKRRREQFEMHEGSEPKGASSDPAGSTENTYSDSRSKGGVQFPFVVGDRVIIKVI